MIDQPRWLQLIVPLGWRLALVLAAGIAFLVVWNRTPASFRPALRSTATGTQAAGDASDDAVQPVRPQSYPAIGERPLFYASRTRWMPPPPPPTPPPVVRAPPPPTHYTLAGVVVSGSARTALVKSQNGRTTTILVEGQQLDGWTLKEITDSQLLFIAGSATYEMKLPKPSEVRR